MKMSRWILTILFIPLLIVACGKPGLNEQTGRGTSSGGGTYGSSSSAPLLQKARVHLGFLIRHSSSDLYKNLPKPFTRESLAELIEKVELHPLETKERDGETLQFDYGFRNGQPYLTALQPFFVAYGSVGADDYLAPHTPYLETEQSRKMRDIEKILLHEADHLFYFNQGLSSPRLEVLANEFSKNLSLALEGDFLICSETEKNDWPRIPNLTTGRSQSLTPDQANEKLNWIYHLPTLTGIVSNENQTKRILADDQCMSGPFHFDLGFTLSTWKGSFDLNPGPCGREFQVHEKIVGGQRSLENAYATPTKKDGRTTLNYAATETLKLESNLTEFSGQIDFAGSYAVSMDDARYWAVFNPDQKSDLELSTVFRREEKRGRVPVRCRFVATPVSIPAN